MNSRCKKTYADCTVYEQTVNEYSSLDDTTCLSVEETIQDIYNQLDTQLNLTELGNECLTYTRIGGKLYTKEVLLTMEAEICALKEEVENLKTITFCDTPINQCGLDFKCLEETCGGEIVTFKDLMQSLINKSCE